MDKHIAIITVIYKNYTVLPDFLKSFENQTNTNFHIFAADGSPDKQQVPTILPLTIIPTENRGYAYGVNVGIKKAMEKGIGKFCVINDDTYVESDFVEKIIASLETHPQSLLGGKIYYAPGYEYHQDRYAKEDLGKVIWYAGGVTDWDHALTHHRGVDEVDKGQYYHVEETEFITGCLMCFDKKVIDAVGYWDDSYFLYYEDADFCERAKRKGINLFFDPSIRIWHKNAQSTEGSGSKLHEKFQKSSRFQYAMKYAPLKTKLHILKNYILQK